VKGIIKEVFFFGKEKRPEFCGFAIFLTDYIINKKMAEYFRAKCPAGKLELYEKNKVKLKH